MGIENAHSVSGLTAPASHMIKKQSIYSQLECFLSIKKAGVNRPFLIALAKGCKF